MTQSHVSKVIDDGKFIGAMISKGGLLAVIVMICILLFVEAGTIIYVLHRFSDRHTGTDQVKYERSHQIQHAAEWEQHEEYAKDQMSGINDRLDKIDTIAENVARIEAKQEVILRYIKLNGGGP